MKTIINVLEKLTGYKPNNEETKDALIGLACCWIFVLIGMFAIYIFC